MLDIRRDGTVIYIWYEGGELRPLLVKVENLNQLDGASQPRPIRFELALPKPRKVPRSEVPASRARARRQPSAVTWVLSQVKPR